MLDTDGTDVEGSNNAGVNGVSFVSDASRGPVAHFDGNDNLVTPDVSGPSTYTLAVWMKTTDVNQQIIGSSSSDRHLLRVDTDGTLYEGSATSPTIPVNDGNWHLVVYVYESGGVADLYVDGVADGQNTKTGLGRLAFGKDYGYDSYFTGRMDDAYFYNRALTQQEVEDLYKATK